MTLLPQVRIDYDARSNFFWLSTDGTNTPTAELNSYTPKGARYDIDYTLIRNNPKVSGYTADLVEDEITCTLRNDTLNRTQLRLLNQIAARARWYNKSQQGYAIVLEVNINVAGGEIWSRSKIYNIEIQHSEEIFNYGLATGDIKVVLTILREPFFEELSPVSLPVLNNSALTIDVSNSPGWNINIIGTNIEGDTPTPAIIGMTNLTAAHTITDIYLGMEVIEAGISNTSNALMIEGESFTGGTLNTTNVNTDSGGATKTFTFPTSEAQITKYTIPAVNIPKVGQWYKVFFRFSGTPGSSPNYIRYKFQKVGATTDEEVYFSSELYVYDMYKGLQDFGVVQLPPYSIYAQGIPSTYEDIEFAIWGYTSGGTSGFQLDYVYFMPITGYRYYKILGNNFDSSHALTDENTDNNIYTTNIGDGKIIPNVTVFGDPIMLIPGYSHFFYLLWNSGNQNYIADQVRLSMQYRRRKNTL